MSAQSRPQAVDQRRHEADVVGWSGNLPEHAIHQAAVAALLGLQPLGHLHPKRIAHLIGGQCAHFAMGGINLIQQLAKPLARRRPGDELPHAATL
jgi:hypothetical protein